MTESPRINPHRRLRSLTSDVRVPLRACFHDLKVSLAYDNDTRLREVAFVTAGRSEDGIGELLSALGICLSRLIQGRDPHTGERI